MATNSQCLISMIKKPDRHTKQKFLYSDNYEKQEQSYEIQIINICILSYVNV